MKNNNFPDGGCQGSFIMIGYIDCDGSVIVWKQEMVIYMYLIQCQTGNMDI